MKGMLKGSPTSLFLSLVLSPVVLVSLTAGAGFVDGQSAPQQTPQAKVERAEPTQLGKKEVARTDLHGDPLPQGAIARLGTVRFRHPNWVGQLAYTPDGKMLVSACWDGKVRWWDPATGKELRRLETHDKGRGFFMRVSHSSNGKNLLVVGSHNVVRALDLNSGKELWQRQVKHGQDFAISPDGKQLVRAVGDSRGKGIALSDLMTGQPIREFGITSRIHHTLAFSPDGKVLAASEDGPFDGEKPLMTGLVRLWDPATGQKLHELRGHQGRVNCVAFSPDGKLLASTSHDATIRLWEPTSGRSLRTISVPQDPNPEYGASGSVVAFSPDGRLLVSGSVDGKVRLWEAGTGKLLHTLLGHTGHASGLAFSPEGTVLATSARCDNTIRLWDLKSGKELLPRDGHDSQIRSIAVSPDGRLAATSCEQSCVIRIWSLIGGQQTHELRGHTDSIFWLAFSADGTMLRSAGGDTIRIWDVKTGRELRKLVCPKEWRWWNSVVFIPPGKTLACTGSPRGEVPVATLRIWDWSTGKEVRQLKAEGGQRFQNLYVSPDGVMLAAMTNEVLFWHAASGKELRRLGQDVVDFALAPDGRTCMTQRSDGSISIWDTETGQVRSAFNGPEYSGGAIGVPSFTFSPDARLLVRNFSPWFQSSAADSKIKLWEVATGKVRRQFVGHGAAVIPLAFSPDGRTLLSGEEDTTILIWDLTRRHESRPDPLTAADLHVLWADLGGDDAERADRAIYTLVARAEQSVPFLRKHLQPVAKLDPQRVKGLITDLESEKFAVRQQATRQLEGMDMQAGPPLRQALKQAASLEAKRRIETLLDKLRAPLVASDLLRSARAVEVLEHIATLPAREVLESLAGGDGDARFTQEAAAALQRLASRASR